jgi:hypothetical protein
MVAQPSTLFLLGPKPPAGPKWRHPRSGDAAGWAGGCWLGGGAGWPALGRKAAYGAGWGCYVLGLSQAGRSSVQPWQCRACQAAWLQPAQARQAAQGPLAAMAAPAASTLEQ